MELRKPPSGLTWHEYIGKGDRKLVSRGEVYGQNGAIVERALCKLKRLSTSVATRERFFDRCDSFQLIEYHRNVKLFCCWTDGNKNQNMTYATEYYETNLAKYFHTHRAISIDFICAAVESICDALEMSYEHVKGPHAHLTATNIFVRGEDEIIIGLPDIFWQDSTDTNDRSIDMYDLGKLILQMTLGDFTKAIPRGKKICLNKIPPHFRDLTDLIRKCIDPFNPFTLEDVQTWISER